MTKDPFKSRWGALNRLICRIKAKWFYEGYGIICNGYMLWHCRYNTAITKGKGDGKITWKIH